MLFQRILPEHDSRLYRRHKVRSLWVTLFSALSPGRKMKMPTARTLESADASSRGRP